MRNSGVEKRGTFNSDGMPYGWRINFDLIDDGKDKSIPVLAIMENGGVLLRGEFNLELTQERAACMLGVILTGDVPVTDRNAPVSEKHTKFNIGDHVEKISGSKWRGRVVGWYSTALTPEGYAVESESETGSVQIYPAKALERVSDHDKRPATNS